MGKTILWDEDTHPWNEDKHPEKFYAECPNCGDVRWPLARHMCRLIFCRVCGEHYLQLPVTLELNCDHCYNRINCVALPHVRVVQVKETVNVN